MKWLQYIYRNRIFILVSLSILVIVGSVLYVRLFGNSEGTYDTDHIYIPYLYDTETNPIKKTNPFVRHSKGEIECRRVMESLFQRPFPSTRPDFLKNAVTGQNLEIDVCNMNLKIGVEYNGRQHYEYTKGMHSSKEAFRNQQYRDLIKRQMCKENGFTLIEVPYTVPVEGIEAFLLEKLKTIL